jgi:hypothetical protein
MEEWVVLATRSRDEARSAALFALLDLALHKARSSVDLQLAANQAEAASVREWLDKFGEDILTRNALLSARQQLVSARTRSDLLRIVEVIYDQHKRVFNATGPLVREGGNDYAVWEAAGRALIDVLAKTSPAIDAIARSAGLWLDVGYGWAAALAMHNRISEIMQLQEASYRDVQRLSKRYIDLYSKQLQVWEARKLLVAQSC